MGIKERAFDPWWGHKRFSSPSYGDPNGTNYSRSTGYQKTASVSHPGPPFREGGPFLMQKVEATFMHQKMAGNAIFDYTFEIDIIPNVVILPALPPPIPYTTMVAKGSEGWSKFAPGQSEADIGTFVGELKDLPGMLKHGKSWLKPMQKLSALKNFSSAAKSAGNEYLAVEFGWKPFVSDLASMADVVGRTIKALKQLRKDNGKTVRRRGNIDVVESTNTVIRSGNGEIWPADYNSYFLLSPLGNTQQRVEVTTSYTRYWFSGAFKYWIPDINAPEAQIRLWTKMLGLNPSPKLVWELTPWSWLADYFTSIGSIMDNVSGNAAENLVATYCFIMGNVKEEKQITVTAPTKPGFPSVKTKARVLTEVKRREAASPYGFGVDLSGLSPKQIAILGALGLSRV